MYCWQRVYTSLLPDFGMSLGWVPTPCTESSWRWHLCKWNSVNLICKLALHCIFKDAHYNIFFLSFMFNLWQPSALAVGPTLLGPTVETLAWLKLNINNRTRISMMYYLKMLYINQSKATEISRKCAKFPVLVFVNDTYFLHTDRSRDGQNWNHISLDITHQSSWYIYQTKRAFNRFHYVLSIIVCWLTKDWTLLGIYRN